MNETLLRISGYHHHQFFCAGAVFSLEPPICTRAGDKISDICLNRGLDKVVALCRLKGWEVELCCQV